jgi:hypothetical protein
MITKFHFWFHVHYDRCQHRKKSMKLFVFLKRSELFHYKMVVSVFNRTPSYEPTTDYPTSIIINIVFVHFITVIRGVIFFNGFSNNRENSSAIVNEYLVQPMIICIERLLLLY